MSQEKSLKELTLLELAVTRALYENGGELTPDVEAAIAITETALPEKVDSYKHILDRIELEVEALKSRQAELGLIIRGLGTTKTKLKENLKEHLITLGKDEVRGTDYRFKLSSTKPTVDVYSEDDLPATFVREKIVHEADKDMIRQALDAGKEVPGARLVESFSIRSYPVSRISK